MTWRIFHNVFARPLEANPRNFTSVLAQAKPGQTIRLSPGTYSIHPGLDQYSDTELADELLRRMAAKEPK